jgi:hypothetical protein
MNGQVVFLKKVIRKYLVDMLIKTLLMPCALSELPKNPSYSELFCNNAIGLLHDLCENCILLVDRDNQIKENLLKNIKEKWPYKYKHKAQKLLSKLQQRRRFIKFEGDYLRSEKCNNNSCRISVGLAQKSIPQAILTSESCYECAMSQISKASEVISITKHTISKFYQNRRNCRSYEFNDGEWNKRDFEEKVLAPLFEHAKHIKIFDRYIGRSIWTRREDAVLNNTNIKPNYRLTIEWLVEVFLRFSHVKNRTFEITCGLSTFNYKDWSEIKVAVNALRQFETEIKEKYNFHLKIIIKNETFDKQMLHARYLITDQIGLLIDPGFDLLWSDRKMINNSLDPLNNERPIRDVVLKYCNNVGNIESSLRRLNDIN